MNAGLIAVAAAALVLLAACDAKRIEGLEEDVSTEADVRRQFGVPEAEYPEPDGGRTLEYPRQPEGQRNYMITIGPDGRMTALRQVLQPASFERVHPGMEEATVRRLLGRPARAQRFDLKGETLWTWRYLDGSENKVFEVTFDREGRVLGSASRIDPRELYGEGR